MLDELETQEIVEDQEQEIIEDDQDEVQDVDTDSDDDTEDTREEIDEEQEGDDSDEEEETVITLDDKVIEKPDTNNKNNSVIRSIRNENRELKKKLKKYESNTDGNGYQPDLLKVPDKPTFESCNYDEDNFQKELDKWYNKKTEINQINLKKQSENKKQQEFLQTKYEKYTSGKAELKIDDFELVENTVEKALSVEQQSALILAAKDPSIVVYALGKNKTQLDQLTKITNPLEFASAIGRLESKLKVTKAKTKPKVKPEKIPQGANASPDSKKAQYEKLLAHGIKTGNMSKASAYRRKHNL